MVKNIMNSKKTAEEIFRASLHAVDPYRIVRLYSPKVISRYDRFECTRLQVIGFGKAACPMAKATEHALNTFIDSGIIITKYNHCNDPYIPELLTVYEGGHPLPDRKGLEGTEKIINLLKAADTRTLVVCLISGGGSALLVAPDKNLSLEDKQTATELLLKAGADIFEVNTVRKHLSRVKGGRLAEIAYPAKMIALILSDVIGDKLDMIASGPTSPDSSSYDQALSVLKKYALLDQVPKPIIDLLEKGQRHIIPETLKQDNPIFQNISNIVIGSNRSALSAAKEKAEHLGLMAEIISSEISGEAKEVGKFLSEKIKKVKKTKRSKKPLCLLSGGETTVTVNGNGLGGRNTELALSFALDIEGHKGITLLSAGTDGTDGPTNAAGAIVDGHTIQKAKERNIDALNYLMNNDSYHFFKKIHELFITGPTGTNVMDIQVAIIE